ncbi:CPBP family intramembrane glutamic endopeptidase [Brevundimonas sp. TWP1-2-1b1]|uniref:CPBP family intramembrane glutamic endopeptidase n=1 Tax=unclassified Brevundimonas TaxID=2622653 RepID=UPI003CE693E7
MTPLKAIAKLHLMTPTAPPFSSPSFLSAVTPEKRTWRAFATAGAFIAAMILVAVALGLTNLAVPGFRDAFELSEAAQTSNRLIEEMRVMGALAVILGLTAALALWFASLIHHRPAVSFLWPNRKPSIRLLLLGAAVSAPITAIILFGYGWLQGEALLFPVLDYRYPLMHRVSYALAAVAALFVAALAEEVLFRGLVLQATAAFTRRILVICAINGVLFAAFHLYADPVVFISLAIAGSLWAWVTLELGGIEFATGAHVANNLCVVLLAEPFTLGWDTAPTAAPMILAFDLFMVLAVAVAVKTLKASRTTALA